MKTSQILLPATIILSQHCNISSAKSLLRKRQENHRELHGTEFERELGDSRIIGGDEANEDRFSYAVSLADDIGHFCGGSLIAKDVILTAAHCQGGSYNIVLGRHDVDDNDGEVIGMKNEVPHPDYNSGTTDSDFMLVFLDSAVTATNVDLVKLNKDSNVPSIGSSVTVMGWGDTDIRDDVSKLSDVLMNVDVNVISNNECDASEGTVDGYYDTYENQITNNMLCARVVGGGEDSCQGDSGGPLVVKGANAGQDVQVGVVSWGIGCASEHFPGVYARVSRSYNWIEDEVCSRSSYASDAGFNCSGSGGSTPTPPSPNPPSPNPPSPSPPSPSPPSSGSGGGSTDDVDDDLYNYLLDTFGVGN